MRLTPNPPGYGEKYKCDSLLKSYARVPYDNVKSFHQILTLVNQSASSLNKQEAPYRKVYAFILLLEQIQNSDYITLFFYKPHD